MAAVQEGEEWDDDMFGNPEVDTTETGVQPEEGKSKQKVKAKGKAKAKAKAQVAEEPSCNCPHCDEPKKKKSPYCDRHTKCFQNMSYQRTNQDDAEAAAAYDAAMANPTTAAEEVETFGEVNPGDAKYKRKTLLEWARFIKKFGHRVEQYEKNKCKPFTELAFNIYATRDQGLTDKEAKAWWGTFYDNPRVERDNFGPLGKQQLFIPGFKSKGTTSGKYVDTSLEESGTAKKANDRERQMLRDQVHHSNTRIGDGFFHGASSSKTSLAAALEESSHQAPGQADKQAAKRTRAVDLDRELPKAFEDFRKAITICEGKMKASLETVDLRETELNQHGAHFPDAICKDRALTLMIRSLQFRAQLAQRWLGHDDFTKWLLPLGGPGNTEPKPGIPGSTPGFGVPGTPGSSTEAAPGTPAFRPTPGIPSFSPSVQSSHNGSALESPSKNDALDDTPVLTPVQSQDDNKPEDVQKEEKASGDDQEGGPGIVAGKKPAVESDACIDPIDPIAREKTRLSNLSLQAFMQENKRYKVISGEVCDLQPLGRMAARLEEFGALEDTDEFLKMKADFLKKLKAGGEVAASLSKASNDVKSHLSTKKNEQVRSMKRKSDDDQKAAVKKARDEVTAAATNIKKKKAEEKSQAKSIFSIDTSEVPAMPTLMGDATSPDWEKPFVRRNSEAFDLMASDTKIQKALTALGAQYKQKGNDSSTPHGMSQYPIEAATGLECADALIATAHISPPKLLDISCVAGGASFHKAAWMFGYAPEMKWDGLSPNCSALQRWLFFGAYRCVAINTADMVRHLAESAGQDPKDYTPTFDELQTFVDALTPEIFKTMKDKGIAMFAADVQRRESLFIPLGWWCIEQSLPNHPLIYGVRKSYMTYGQADMRQYLLQTTIHGKSGRGVDRMHKISEKMRDTDAQKSADP